MSVKRIIPCLDIKNGRVVKGIEFINLIDAGDPVECAIAYEKAGADELTILDISATSENRSTILDVVSRIAEQISIPLAVGGGVRAVEDFERILNAGANKIGVNSAALKRPELISEAAAAFGSKCVVAAIDAKKRIDGTGWDVYYNAGKVNSGKDVLKWAHEVQNLGAGEILLTSIDKDGTKSGFDIELTKAVSEVVDIPVTASGGAGKLEHFKDAIIIGKADAVLAASLFHFGEMKISDLKEYLKNQGIEVSI